MGECRSFFGELFLGKLILFILLALLLQYHDLPLFFRIQWAISFLS